MTLNYLPHQRLVESKTFDVGDQPEVVDLKLAFRSSKSFKIIEEKLRTPKLDGIFSRPRLQKLLERSVDQYGITLICGRSGTGKTVLAADFLTTWEDAAWFTVEAADTSWETFATYFVAALFEQSSVGERTLKVPDVHNVTEAGIAAFLIDCMRRIDSESTFRPRIIVLDNIHHLYDAEWFPDFFKQLIFSLGFGVHFLLLGRSKPPVPLWRLRSKQMLNVIDEKLIAFTVAETEAVFKSMNLPPTIAKTTNQQYFGRISKLLEFAGRSPTK